MARSFSGSGQYGIATASQLNLTANQAVTVACWANPGAVAAAGFQNLICQGFDGVNVGWYLRLDNGVLQGGSFNGADNSATWTVSGWSNGQWAHVAVVYDGAAWRLYFNGAQVASTTTATGPVHSTFSSGIATDPGLTTRAFNGLIADALVCGTNLLSGEIGSLAGGARPHHVARNRIWFVPLDGLQSPEPDLSGFAANATLTGSPPFAAGPPVNLFTPRWPVVLGAAGAASRSITGAQTIGLLASTGAIQVLAKILGSQTLALLTQSAALAESIHLVGAQTLTLLTQTAALKVIDKLTASQTLALLTETGVLRPVPRVVGAQTLGLLTQSATLREVLRLVGAETLALIQQTGAISTGNPAVVSDIYPRYRRLPRR